MIGAVHVCNLPHFLQNVIVRVLLHGIYYMILLWWKKFAKTIFRFHRKSSATKRTTKSFTIQEEWNGVPELSRAWRSHFYLRSMMNQRSLTNSSRSLSKRRAGQSGWTPANFSRACTSTSFFLVGKPDKNQHEASAAAQREKMIMNFTHAVVIYFRAPLFFLP